MSEPDRKQYPCPEEGCEAVYYNTSSLRTHRHRVHSRGATWTCAKCNQSHSDPRHAEKCVVDDKTYKCQYCPDKEFTLQKYLPDKIIAAV